VAILALYDNCVAILADHIAKSTLKQSMAGVTSPLRQATCSPTVPRPVESRGAWTAGWQGCRCRGPCCNNSARWIHPWSRSFRRRCLSWSVGSWHTRAMWS